jgi:anti-sigma factor RsiW
MHGSSQLHDGHDHYLVAAYAAGDLEPRLRVEAESLTRSCGECAVLLADLRSIAAATAALPPVRRTRDFRISADDAVRLRPAGWRRLLETLVGARSAFSRPLAVGLTTIGLVGVLATTIPGALSGLGGSVGAPEYGAFPANAPGAGALATAGPALASSPQASVAAASGANGGTKVDTMASIAPSAAAPSAAPVVPGPASPSPAERGGEPGTKNPQDKGFGTTDQTGAQSDQTPGEGARFADLNAPGGGPSPILVGSLVCLIAGLGLLLARWGAGRLLHR